jgi:hypothetical protein
LRRYQDAIEDPEVATVTLQYRMFLDQANSSSFVVSYKDGIGTVNIIWAIPEAQKRELDALIAKFEKEMFNFGEFTCNGHWITTKEETPEGKHYTQNTMLRVTTMPQLTEESKRKLEREERSQIEIEERRRHPTTER